MSYVVAAHDFGDLHAFLNCKKTCKFLNSNFNLKLHAFLASTFTMLLNIHTTYRSILHEIMVIITLHELDVWLSTHTTGMVFTFQIIFCIIYLHPVWFSYSQQTVNLNPFLIAEFMLSSLNISLKLFIPLLNGLGILRKCIILFEKMV